MKQLAVPIPLKVWQDPQGNVVLNHSRSNCVISFGCWEAAGEPADYICQLKFHHDWVVRGVCSEYIPYEYAAHHRSCIYEIVNSEWLKLESQVRKNSYPDWDSGRWPAHHYVVQGHDNFYEVIAASFEEVRVPYSEAGELVRLIDEA